MLIELHSLAVIAVGATLGLAFVVPRWLCSRASHMRCAAHHFAIMGDAATELVGNPDTPPMVVNFVRGIVNDGNRPRVAWAVAKWVLARPKQVERTEFGSQVRQLEDREQRLLALVIGNAVMASAHSDLLFATPLQRLLQWGMTQENPARFEPPEKAWGVADKLQTLRPHQAFA